MRREWVLFVGVLVLVHLAFAGVPSKPVPFFPGNAGRTTGNAQNLSWAAAFDSDTDLILFDFENVSGWSSSTDSIIKNQTTYFRQTTTVGDTNSRGMNWTFGNDHPEISYTFSPRLNLSAYTYIKFYAKSTVQLSAWQLTLLSPDDDPIRENSTTWTLEDLPCGDLEAGEECFYEIDLTTGTDEGVFNLSDVETISFSTTTASWSSGTENRSVFIDYMKVVTTTLYNKSYYVYFNSSESLDFPNITTATNASYEATTIDGTTYYWKIVATNGTGNSTASDTFNFLENTAPDVTALNISPNPVFTDNNLTCNYAYYDNQSDDAETDGEVWVRWYNGTQARAEYENETVVNYANISRDEVWFCNVTIYDAYEWSSRNWTTITVQNTKPVISLISDDSDPATPTLVETNVTFTITWSDTDLDVASIFVCNSTAITAEGCDSKHLCNITNTSTSPVSCQYNFTLADPGVMEYWVAACDSANCSNISSMNKVAVAKAPYPTVLLAPANESNSTTNIPVLSWVAAFDENRDLLVANFDDFAHWTYSNLGNLTLQTIFRRDNSTFGLNWTLVNDGADGESSANAEYTPAISKAYSSKDISDYEYFEVYFKALNTNISNIHIDLWDANSNRSMWYSNETGCGFMDVGEECFLRINITSTPQYAAGTFDSETLTYVIFRVRESDFGNGSLSQTENGSLMIDYAKFVDIEADNVEYRLYVGDDTVQGVNTTAAITNISLATTEGTTYYWKIQPFDELYNATASGAWYFDENTGPLVYNQLPNITFRKNFNYTIDLYSYFNDTDGDELTFNWTGNDNITVTNISQATGSYNVTFTPSANWTGTELITFAASDDLEGIENSSYVTVNNTVPTAPVLWSPPDYGRLNNNTYTLFWNASTDADNDTITYFIFYTNESFDYSLHLINQTNFTNYTVGSGLALDSQNYTWSIIATDWTGNSTSNNISKFVENAPPVLSSVQILPSPSNKLSNITCNYTYSDTNGDLPNITQIKWYNTTEERTDLENITLIGSGNVTEGETWNCSVRIYDQYEWSAWYNASREIGDYYIPNMTFDPPRDTYNRGDSITLNLVISPEPLNATSFEVLVVETGENITLSGSGTQYSGSYTLSNLGALTFDYNYSDAQDALNISRILYVSGAYNLTNVTVNKAYSNGDVSGNVSFILYNANNETLNTTVFCNSTNSTFDQIEYTSASTVNGSGACLFDFDVPGFHNISVFIRHATGNNASDRVETNIDWITLLVVSNKSSFEENEFEGVNVTLSNSTWNASGAVVICNDTWVDPAGFVNISTTTANQTAYCSFNFTEPGTHTVNVTATWGGITVTNYTQFYVYPAFNATFSFDYSNTTYNRGEMINISLSITNSSGSVLPPLNETYNVSMGGALFQLLNGTDIYTTVANMTTAGTYSAFFKWTNTSTNLSAYVDQTIVISPDYNVEYSSGNLAVSEYDAQNYTFYVADVHGSVVPSITNGTCTVTSPANTTNATGSNGYYQCRVSFASAKSYTVTMTVYRDGNFGSASTTVSVTADDGNGNGGGGGGNGGGIIIGTVKKNVKFDDYPEEIEIKRGKSKTVSFKLKNTGNDTSNEAKIKISNINETWYSSSVKSIAPGDTKTISVKFTIPEDAEEKFYSMYVKAYADVCSVKNANGTYTSVSLCERKTITLSVVEPTGDEDEDEDEEEDEDEDEDEAANSTTALAMINSASAKKKELQDMILDLIPINVSTIELEGLLVEGNTELAVANASYSSEDYDDAKNSAGKALLKYSEGLGTGKVHLDGFLGTEKTNATSLLVELAGNVPPEQEFSYSLASQLIDQGDDHYINGEYELAKASYSKAYDVLVLITPIEGEEEEEEGRGLLWILIIIVVIAILGVLAFFKRDVVLPYLQNKVVPGLKDLPGTLKKAPAFFKSLPSRIKNLPQTLAELPTTIRELPDRIVALTLPVTISKHTWPDNIRHMMENEVSVTISLYNKGQKNISAVEIEDFLPSYFYLMPETLTVINRAQKPEIKKVANGSKLRLKFGEIGSGESLALVYKFKVVPTSKVLHVPSAKLKVTIDKKTVRLNTKPFSIGVV